jgi:hypothetical protein
MRRTRTVEADEALKLVDDFVRFVFFPVGHGSCTLVSFPPEEPGGNRVYGVIDCHDATARPIRAYLAKPWFARENISAGSAVDLRFVALTHYHEDHVLGINYLFGGDSPFRCRKFLCPFPPAGDVARRMKSHSLMKGMLTKIHRLSPKPVNFMKIYDNFSWVFQPTESRLRDIEFMASAIAPSNTAMARMKELRDPQKFTPFNLLSSAFRFQWGDCSVIISGDVEDDEWDEVLLDLESANQLDLLAANVALCSHHGGRGNPDALWQRISRCSSFHKPGAGKRVSRTLIVVPCGSDRDKSPCLDSLRTFFNANALVRCTLPSKACQGLHAGGAPSCVIPDFTLSAGAEPVELLPGEKPSRVRRGGLPPIVGRARNALDFRKGSICVDVFPKRAPRVSRHDGLGEALIVDRCSCAAKL